MGPVRRFALRQMWRWRAWRSTTPQAHALANLMVMGLMYPPIVAAQSCLPIWAQRRLMRLRMWVLTRWASMIRWLRRIAPHDSP